MLLELPPIEQEFKSSDLIVHYYRFSKYDLNLSFFSNLQSLGQVDIFLPLEYYIGNYFNIKKEIIPFISVFLTYCLILQIFSTIFKAMNCKYINLLFLIFLLSISFNLASLTVRNYTAICIAIYGIFLIFYQKKLTQGFLFLFLSNSVHIMTFIITIAAVLFKLFNRILNKSIVFFIFITSITFIIIPENIIAEMLLWISSFTPDFIAKKIINYTSGYWALEYLEDRSMKGLIFLKTQLYVKLFFVIFTIFYLKNRIKNIELYYFIALFSSCLFLVYGLPNIFGRYLDFSFLGSFILFLIYFKENNQINKKILIILSFVTITLLTFSVYSMKYYFPITLPKLFLPTLYNLIFDSIPYENWIQE